MEWLAGFSLAEAGPTALLSLFVLMIFTGRLIPKSTVDATTENWRTAYNNEREARQEQSGQIARLTSSLETVDALLKALRIEAEKSHSGESPR